MPQLRKTPTGTVEQTAGYRRRRLDRQYSGKCRAHSLCKLLPMGNSQAVVRRPLSHESPGSCTARSVEYQTLEVVAYLDAEGARARHGER